MPNALIVEDEPLLRAELRDHLHALWPELNIVGEAENGIAAVAAIDVLKPDIVFLDIQIPGLNGLEVAKHIPEFTQVVFVTAYGKHALQAFDAGAADYLVKPIDMARLLQTIKRLKSRQPNTAKPSNALWGAAFGQVAPVAPQYLKWIKASVANTVRLVVVGEVQYFQSDKKYTRVVTPSGEALIRLTLKELLDQLDPAQFTQIHRSTIVNLNAIDRIVRDSATSSGTMEIHLKNIKKILVVSDAFTKQFRQM